jgi:hypothetical protein
VLGVIITGKKDQGKAGDNVGRDVSLDASMLALLSMRVKRSRLASSIMHSAVIFVWETNSRKFHMGRANITARKVRQHGKI